MTIGIAPSNAKAAPVVRFSAPGPSVARQTPGRPVNRPCVAAMNAAACSWRVTMSLMLDRRSELDDIEIFFTWYAEDPLDAFILQGGDKQVRTFHMLASWLMASEHEMIHTISSNCLSARLGELAGQRRYQYQLSRLPSVAGDGHTVRQYGG